MNFGKVHVVYPEATEERTTATLLLEIDPVRLVRGSGNSEAQGSLAQYVNDRPYVASSFVSVALAEMFGATMSGRSKSRQELVDTPIPLEIHIPVLPCRSDEGRIKRLFEPLGYEVTAVRLPLDEKFPEWGTSPYYDVKLKGMVTVRDAMRHLYSLLPTLDARKHYFMDPTEVQKLLSKGEGWLENHPEKDWVVRASLGRKPSLMRQALEQLSNAEEVLEVEAGAVDEVMAAPDDAGEEVAAATTKKEKAVSLHQLRHQRIVELVREIKPRSLVDLGCGEGKLMRLLVPIRGLDRILGMDVSYFELEKATKKLRLEDAGPRVMERIELIHGSLMYRDDRIAGFDACTVIEVIEHLDPPRLAAFERVVFQYARPKTVLLTTPNREYNAVYEVEEFRHTDHRFEWTREEFQAWGDRIADLYQYQVRYEGIGDEHEEYGQPSQMAVFTR